MSDSLYQKSLSSLPYPMEYVRSTWKCSLAIGYRELFIINFDLVVRPYCEGPTPLSIHNNNNIIITMNVPDFQGSYYTLLGILIKFTTEANYY